MPTQAQIYIGERVHDLDEAREAFRRAGLALDDGADPYEGDLPVAVQYRGQAVTLHVYLHVDSEGAFPVPRDEAYSCALVGMELTSRYRPTLLDRDHEYGRPDPFEFDPLELAGLLAQVRKTWPEAEALIMDTWY